MKTTFKITWISILSTIVTVLAHVLAGTKYHTIFVVKTPVIDIPYLFIIITILTYLLMTLIFIGIKNYLPTSKLTKGFLYSSLVSFVWITLNLEPTTINSIQDFIIEILIIFIPMSVYGIFLGYLSNEKTNKIKITISYLRVFIIMLMWLLFRGLYYLIDADAPKTVDIIQTALWLIISGFVIGVVFSIFQNLIKETLINRLVWIFNISFAVFVCYYLVSYSLEEIFYTLHYVKILFDILSIIIGTLLSVLIFERKKVEIN